jgi:excisionase family DNA binding protein
MRRYAYPSPTPIGRGSATPDEYMPAEVPGKVGLHKKPYLEAAKKYDPDTDYVLTTGEVADVFAVTTQCIRNWIREGVLRARTTPGGRFRISVSSVLRARGIQTGEADEMLRYFTDTP